MNILATLKQALDDLKAVLCDPEGAVCITGSDGDRTVTQQALANFSAAINQIEKAEPAAFAVQLAEDGSLSWNTIWEERWAANDHLNSLIQEGLHTGECHVLPLFTFPPDAQEEIERLTKERDSFYMDYRMKCDEETKELNQQLDAERQLRVRQVEELNQLVDHLRQQLAEREGWQPIETAPYGTNVLAWLYLPRNPIASGPVVASRSFVEKDEPESYGEFRQTVGCWWANGRFYHADSDTGYVTHWMPLPAAPKPGDIE